MIRIFLLIVYRTRIVITNVSIISITHQCDNTTTGLTITVFVTVHVGDNKDNTLDSNTFNSCVQDMSLRHRYRVS